MDELISRLMVRAGLSEAQARQALVIVLAFLEREAPAETLERFLTALPGAAALLAPDRTEQPIAEDTRHFGGVARLMRVADQMLAAGLDMTQVQATVREVLDYARTMAGPDTVDEMILAIPGLRQVL